MLPQRTRDATGHDFLATAARGTERVLARELEALGAQRVVPERGAVSFCGPLPLAWNANLRLRTANHVLLRLGRFPVDSADALYAGALDVRWEDLLTTRSTFAVRAAGTAPGVTHSGFAALRVKDAIADRLRSKLGARPDVDTRDPAVRVAVHLAEGEGSVFLDTTGESLHRRGYRAAETDAPLRETLAAAIVLWSGWDRKRPLLDPMCGSGTIAIEAALLATNAAPGRNRRFGFERWPGFGDAERREWARIRAEAEEGTLDACPATIAGSDRSEDAVAAARANARAARVDRLVRLDVADVRSIEPRGGSGMLVFNPPYGHRIGGREASLESLYRALGQAARRFRDHVVVVLSGNRSFERLFGLRPAARFATHNGALPCSVLRYEV